MAAPLPPRWRRRSLNEVAERDLVTAEGILWGFLMMAPIAAASGFAGYLSDVLLQHSSQDAIVQIVQWFPRWARWAAAGVAAVLAPLGEETLFRGVVFRRLEKAGQPVLGALLSAALFASAHREPNEWLSLFVFGLGMAWLYRHTKTLASPMTVHALSNLVVFSVHILSR